MKPAPFLYAEPENIAETLALLAEHGADGKLLAGGQSLMPLLNMRLARPAVIVDLNRVRSLDYITEQDGELHIGAMTRQRTAERSAMVASHAPLLADALRWVGHVQIRNRGTIGGSLAHADPAAELPAVASVLEATFVLARKNAQRTVSCDEFFVSQLTTALEPDEVLVEVRIPRLPPNTGWAFAEVARRHGDFALVGVAATVLAAGGGRYTSARLAFTGVGAVPVRIPDVEGVLEGQRFDSGVLDDVARLVGERLDPTSDLQASASYRKHVAGALAARALRAAAARASEGCDA